MPQDTPERLEAGHDETPPEVDDHEFEARGEWWSLCKHCRLARSAHARVGRFPYRYYSDDLLNDD
jgi:hypothetical protein